MFHSLLGWAGVGLEWSSWGLVAMKRRKVWSGPVVWLPSHRAPVVLRLSSFRVLSVALYIVGGRHFVAVVGVILSRVELLSCQNRGAMRIVIEVVAGSEYILFASVRGTVGVVHRSRVGWCRGVAGIRRGHFLGGFRYVGWDRSEFYRYVSVFDRGVFAGFKFQVGLAVGDR